MLRTVAKIYNIEGQFITRDIYKICSVGAHSRSTTSDQTVVSSEVKKSNNKKTSASFAQASSSNNEGGFSQPPPRPPQPPPPSPRTWAAVAALTLSASLGGVYLYRKYTGTTKEVIPTNDKAENKPKKSRGALPKPVPALASELPAHAQYLLLGGGTAAFAAMRAIRSAKPDAQVLLVSAELALPYMRPPLSKELWREPELAAAGVEQLSFRQWNGKRRSVLYEPAAFYTPAERLRDAAPGAGVARGWRATRLDPERHEVLLAAADQTHTITYDKCLIATGAEPRRVRALAAAAAAGRSLALRSVADAARLAEHLQQPDTRSVLLVGGGFLGVELAAALAERLRDEPERRVVLACREPAPLWRVLPPYLAHDAARRLTAAGVELMCGTEVTDSGVSDGRVRVQLADGGALAADVVVECAGAAPDPALALASGLELYEGAVLVNAELQARADLWAAGDAASFHSPLLGRRRVEHHDNAVLSGRRAGENMVGPHARAFDHHAMYWSDVGQQLGYEAVGITDSRLRTVGVFSSEAVTNGQVVSEAGESVKEDQKEETRDVGDESSRRYERGVVFYLRDERVVGVLLWNLFNRIQVARQVLSQGKFDDLFEVAKLFSPHEEN